MPHFSRDLRAHPPIERLINRLASLRAACQRPSLVPTGGSWCRRGSPSRFQRHRQKAVKPRRCPAATQTPRRSRSAPMLAFQRFLQQQAAAAAAEEEEHEYDVLVEQLVQRVAEAVLVGDRREALQQLRDLLTGSSGAKAQHAFGTVGFPVMLHQVRERGEGDAEMLQLALESLAAAVGGGEGGATGEAAAINAQQLARTPEALPLLLALLEQGAGGVADFYARYHTLQVIKGLAASAPRQLQEAILGAPLGMTRLMDLLGEQEVLRNEALLLLTQLASGSADLQQIAVFEGAFDRLFGIIREEGLLDGDIVVQDCFQLMAALLRGSPPNQLMFRETGFLAQLPTLLRLPAEVGNGAGVGGAELAPQKAANLVAAMDVVLALLPPAGADPAAPVCASAAENRQALLQRGLLGVLEALALQQGGAPDEGVRAQALLCLAALVGGSRLQQDQLAALSINSTGGQPPQPLLQAVLQGAVAGGSAAEQLAADRLLEAYCAGNSAGQAVLAGSLLHAGAAAPGSFGGYLLQSLGRQGGFQEVAASTRAAGALSHVLAGNSGMQSQLLQLQVALQAEVAAALPGFSGAASAGSSVALMAVCASHLGLLATQFGRQPASAAAAAGMLRLLLLWLHACPPAVTAFLRAVAQSQPYLVDSIRGSNACSGAAASGHPLTRGMLALLLGLCASYAEDAPGTPTRAQLLGAIASQIGQQQYQGILDSLQQHTAAVARDAAAGSSSAALFAGGPSCSPAFAAFLQTLIAEVRQRVSGVAPSSVPLPAPPLAPAAVAAGLPPPPLQPPAAPLAPATAPGLQPLPYGGAAPHLPHSAAHHAAPPPWVPPKPSTPNAAAAPTVFNPAAVSTAGAGASRSAAPSPLAGSPRGAVAPPAAPTNSFLAPPKPFAPVAPPPAAALPSAGSGGSAVEVQQLQAAMEALQRENERLRAECTSLADRLRVNGSNHVHAESEAAAAAAARQQLVAAQQAAAEAETAAERARADAKAAQAAARKLETDLEDLSAAYSNLDAHAGSLHSQLERLESELAAARQQGGAAGPAGQHQQGSGGDSSSGGRGRGVSEEEVQRRVEAARQEAAEEADEAMGDLLVCLGQEEAKVARLQERLEAFGVDVDALLADIVAAGEAGDGDDLL
ncbi:hypothetical protein ABPG75_008324 [Micractinium tetrahymenae]